MKCMKFLTVPCPNFLIIAHDRFDCEMCVCSIVPEFRQIMLENRADLTSLNIQNYPINTIVPGFVEIVIPKISFTVSSKH